MEKVLYPSGSGGDMAANPVTRGVGSASDALHSGIDRIAEPVRNVVDSASTSAHATVNKIANSAASASDRFSEQTRRFTEAPGKALECTRSWVQEKPIQAVAVALAFGFVFGRLTSR